MSKVKKMKLVPYESLEKKNNQEILLKNLLSETAPERTHLNYLDDSMSGILNSELDEDSKLKLFKQALNRYTIYRQKIDSKKNIPNIPEISSPLNTDANNTTLTTSKGLVPINSFMTSTPASSSNTVKKKRISTNVLKSIKKQRAVKSQAISRIKKIFDEKSSSDDESNKIWKPYHSPKKIRRMQSRNNE